MDPAGAGALIGVACLMAFGLGMKIYDIWKEKEKKKEKNPLLSNNEITLRIVRQHSKMNMIVPK
jgi:hypothetical protein